jgi:tape measure domain-containing protein
VAWNVGDSENIIVEAELVGAREFAADADMDAAAIERMGLATKAAGVEAEGFTRRSFLMQQSIFTLRRVAYSGTLAFAALGAGAVYMGLKFDATMEQNTVTMSHFLGSVGNAKKELQTLFQIAATTPFDFAGVSTAAKQFLAFGFSVSDTNKDLRVIADTASAFGGSDDVINRIVLALGQMQAKGKVMGQELRQLQEVGVPALQILQQQLGLTNDQINRIGTTGIKSSVAIPALIKGLQEKYGGLSAQQAKTLTGQLSTLRDYAAQTLGVVMMPLFKTLRDDILPTAILVATAIQKGFAKDGLLGSLLAVEQSNAPEWFKQLYATIYQFVTFLNGPWREGLTPVAKDLLIIAGAAVILLGETLKLLNELDHFHHIVGLLITAWITYKLTTMGVAFWNSMLEKSFVRLAISMAASGIKSVAGAAVRLWNLMRFGAVLEGEVMVETEALTVAYGEQTVATEALTVATVELDAAVLAIPLLFFAVIAAIIAVIAILVILYFKWDWFHKKVDLVGNAIWDFFKGLAGLIGAVIGQYVTESVAAIEYLIHKAEQAKKVLDRITPSGFGFGDYLRIAAAPVTGGASLAGMADGGTVVRSGLSWVGERGPELMWLPQSATVAPLDHMGTIGGDGGGAFTSHTTIVLDRKVVGEASAKYQLDQEARK